MKLSSQDSPVPIITRVFADLILKTISLRPTHRHVYFRQVLFFVFFPLLSAADCSTHAEVPLKKKKILLFPLILIIYRLGQVIKSKRKKKAIIIGIMFVIISFFHPSQVPLQDNNQSLQQKMIFFFIIWADYFWHHPLCFCSIYRSECKFNFLL